jgi:tellurite resistance protein
MARSAAEAGAAGGALMPPLALAALALSWQLAAAGLGWPLLLARGLGLAAALLLALALGVEGWRWLSRPASLIADLGLPERNPLLPALPLTLLLLAALARDEFSLPAGWLWGAGALLQGGLTVVLMRSWLEQPGAAAAAEPLRLLPVAGGLLAPVAGVGLGFREPAWALFGAGAGLGLLLLPGLFQRLTVRPAPGPASVPGFWLLAAVPACAVPGATALGATPAEPALQILAATAGLLLLMLLSLVPRLLRAPYGPGWWACPFSVSMLAAMAVLYHDAATNPVTRFVAILLVLAATVVTTLVGLEALRPRSGSRPAGASD